MLDRVNWRGALLVCGAGLVAATAAALPSAAHHSYAMFDRGKTISITGSIRTWEMVNPHSYLWVNVTGDDKAPQVWGLEGGGTAALMRAGVTKSLVKPGEKVTVDLHPLRDGRTGGMLVNVKLESGRTISFGPATPAPGGNPSPGE